MTALLLFALTGLSAQTFTTRKTASGKLLKWYEKSVEDLRAGAFDDALKGLERVLESDSTFVDARFERGSIFYDREQYAQAEADFETGLALAPEYRPVAWYQLGVIEMKQRKFGEAAVHFERYLNSDATSERQRELAQKLLDQSRFMAEAFSEPVPFDPQRLGPGVNTPAQEYLPSLTAEANTLVFTRVVNGQEDFYVSTKENGEWQRALPLEEVNTPFNEGAQAISADGKTLLFTACNRPDAVGRCDLYLSEFKNGKWTPVRNLGEPVNSRAWESQPSLSGNGRELYFASDRAGGRGEKDIWVSSRLPDGRWSQPRNLEEINTSGDEKTPFIHPDGQTLYFMSEGHPGMGGFDLFYSRLGPNGKWGKPVNLGYPINGPGDEGLLVIALDGKTAYFASNRTDLPGGRPADGPVADYDIFTFELYPEARPQPVTYVKARVFDAQTRRPLQAELNFAELSGGDLQYQGVTGDDGAFLLVLPVGKNYALQVSKEQYLFHSEHFELSGENPLTDPFLLEIGLDRIPEQRETDQPAGKPVVLRNIFFETGSAVLLPASKAELEYLRSLLVEYNWLRIRINGHTDDVGTEADNQQLSEARAKAVYDYLIREGIEASRLSYKGFGESQPLAPNDTPQGRRQNRRTEFEILPEG